jgi:hypothetical protein
MTRKIIWIICCILFALAIIAGAAGLFGQTAHSQPLMTTVSGTVYEYADTTAAGTGPVVSIPMREGSITIHECVRGTLLIYRKSVTVKITNGAYSFQVPRSLGTDTTKIRVSAPISGLEKGTYGVWVAIPEAATADLESLPRNVYVGIPSGMIAAVPKVYIGESGDVSAPDTLLFSGVTVTDVFGTKTITVTGGSGGSYGDSIHVADSLARVALDSASAARQSLLNQVAALTARIDTAGTYTRIQLYAQIATLFDSLGTIEQQISALDSVITLHADTLASLRADLDAHRNGANPHPVYLTEPEGDGRYQALLTPAQQALLDSSIAAGVRVVIYSVGKIRVIEVDTAGLMIHGNWLYNNLVASINNKLNSDTASLGAALDGLYARSGGASVWTTATNYVYRDGGITLGGTTSPWSNQAGVYIPRNLKQHPDSSSRLGVVHSPSINIDSTGSYFVDSLGRVSQFVHAPKTIVTEDATTSGWAIGLIDLEFVKGGKSELTENYLRSDTVNGVTIVDVKIEAFGSRFGGSGGGYSVQSLHRTSSATVLTSHASTPGGNVTSVSTAEFLNWVPAPSGGNIVRMTWNETSDRVGFVKMSIMYAIPSGNASAVPVYLTD